MKRRSGIALAAAVGALLAGASISWGSVSAAPNKTPSATTIYSDTFEPFSRFGDGDSLEHARYTSLNSAGPGASPNFFTYRDGSGHDAFFNSPDLTIGTKPMSAVSAEVCLKVIDESDLYDPYNPEVYLLAGVQDGAGNFILAEDTTGNPMPQVTAGEPTCVTMTFDTPVKLVNRPHLVAVLDMKLKVGMFAEVDGVTYTLRPTAVGDVAPDAQTNPALPEALLPRR
jgi:hypothetical protein